MVLSLTILLAFGVSMLVTWFMEHLSGTVPLIGTFLRLRLTHNPHIAFSIALPPLLQTLLIGGALIAVCIAALQSKDRPTRISFGIILGGALANIADRLSDGLVTDYIAVGTFPVFNAADVCITIGAGLLILEGMRTGKRN